MNEESLFARAVAIGDASERVAFLDCECAGNAELRREVEELLSAHAAAGGFLHRPEVTASYQNASLPPRPNAVGQYKLLEAIGEGGMGEVWVAEQMEPIKRRVALKLIKPGMDSRAVLARFEAERQALALMDHPNIAKVLDAGTTEDGRPYFVMELVKGTPITKFCDERKLSTRERLELFIPVCQAIQHAHQKGIIHRDIKPSNVLVALHDEKPVPKVIDFGVAKAIGQQLTEKTLYTGFGALVGTPAYMAPEQATFNQLDIDTRSDIYSLGVLLYELLAGSPPFEPERLKKAALDEVLRLVREEDPPRPSARLSTSETLASIAAVRHSDPARLTKLLRGELDWVVMKALEKDRNRRYETANGFAMDVQRYLVGEAVQAVPPSAGYRLKKFARRNKGGLAVAALVLFFLVVLGGGAGWAWRDRSAREAEAARQQADRQARVAGQVEPILAEMDRLEKEQKWPQALAVARRAGAAVAGGEADAATAERVHQRLRDLEFLDRLEQIRMQRATMVEGKFDDAGADRNYARAFRDYGVDVDALAVETSIDRLKSRPALAIPLAAALDDWVYCRRKVSEADAAAWKRLVAVARGVDREPLRDRLRSTWGRPVAEMQDELRRLAASIDARAQHPATVVILAYTLLRANRSTDAIRLLRDAHFASPGDFWLCFELGNILSEQNDQEEAIRFRTAALSIRPHSSAAHNNLGVTLAAQKKQDDAIACYRKAIELDPKSARAYFNLGNALREQKKLEEAVAGYRKAIELAPSKAAYHHNLGLVLREQKKVGEAIAVYRKAIEVDPKYAEVYDSLGAILCDVQREYEKAEALFRKAIALDPKHALAHGNLGVALVQQGKLDDAIAAFRTAIELDPIHAKARQHLCQALGNKGWNWVNNADPKLRDPKRSVEVIKEAIELDPQSTIAWQYLGWIQYRNGDWRASIEALEKSCKLQARGTGDSYQWIVLALAHAQLAADEELPDEERMRHRAESLRWYEPSAKNIDGRKWTRRPSGVLDQAVWDFRQEARKLIGPKEEK